MLRSALILLFSRTGALRLVYRLLRDRRVPFKLKLIVLAAILYIVSPIDFMPDIIPVTGWIDDILMALVSMIFFLGMSPKEAVTEHLRNMARERKPGGKVVDGSYRVVNDEKSRA